MSVAQMKPRLVVDDGLAIVKNELHGLLREGKIEEFNQRRKKSKVDLSSCNLRGVDLRGIDATQIDFSGSYLRQADMRGLDLRTCNLEGASLHHAVVSGVYFPNNLSPEEIYLSVREGTRLRLKK
jgi:uncharacterized protein YjbI with pentapeptide repeats